MNPAGGVNWFRTFYAKLGLEGCSSRYCSLSPTGSCAPPVWRTWGRWVFGLARPCERRLLAPRPKTLDNRVVWPTADAACAVVDNEVAR
jgi:hypothetical protein